MSKTAIATRASILTVLSAATASFGAPTLVALTGGIAPGGTTAYSAFTNPTISSSGQVEFLAALAGGTTNANLFAGLPGALQAVALQGAAAPSGGGTYNLINSTTATQLPPIYGNGQLAFSSTLTGGTATSGVFSGTPGSLTTVALQGGTTPTGGTYSAFTIPAAVNPSGQVAFVAGVTGGTTTSALFVGAPGSLQTAATLGGTTPSGGVYATVIAAPLLNASGQVAFISLNGASQGIFAGTPGSLQTAMLNGAVAPGTGGQTYGNPTSAFSYNNSNQVAFSSGLSSGGTSTTGLFAGAPGSVAALALNNTAAPGGLGNYSTFFGVTINNAGRSSFGANLTGGTATAAIFTGTPGALTTIARQGQGASTGVAGETFASFGSPVPNATGGYAFTGNIAGPSVTTANDSALFIYTPGNVALVVREGDLVDVDPTAGVDNRTVTGLINLVNGSGGGDGKATSFNDNGTVAYRLTFTDGSSGVFTSPVPEPTGLAMVAVGAAGLLRRRRATRA